MSSYRAHSTDLPPFYSDWVCSHTNKPLMEISNSDFTNLINWTAFDMITKCFGSETKANFAIQTDDPIAKEEYSKLEKEPFDYMSLYGHITPPIDELDAFFPNVENWSNVEIEFNPEIDHFDLDGNFVKGVPKE